LERATSPNVFGHPAEISSVKTGVVSRVAELLPPKIEYLSLHPLFGPSVRRLKGRNMIAIPVKQGWLSDHMIASLRDRGFTVEISSVEEHDRIMATLQVMHHYAYLVMGVELAKIIKANPRVSKFLTRSMRRTWDQLCSMQKVSETVLTIQEMNPHGPAARRAYAEST